MSCGMWSAVSSRVLPWPLHWNQELMLCGGPAFPAWQWIVTQSVLSDSVDRWRFWLVTHVPGAYKHRDHVWFRLLRMFVLHLLEQLAETFSLLPRHETKHCKFQPTARSSQNIWSHVQVDGNLLVCLLPLCSQTQTLYAESFLSPSPGWAWCVPSEISPAAELKHDNHNSIK